MTNRYTRQLALPEMSPEKQETLRQSKILIVGAGGLGSAALPYLAGAGVGHIIVADSDQVDISNLHRQIMYKTDQEGRVKSTMAGVFLTDLNPEIDIYTIDQQISKDNAAKIVSTHSPDLLLDGSDNFETKALLNDVSIELHIPFICASISQFEGQIGSFEGYKAEKPCYRCLFPEFPESDETIGPLGTCAAIIGAIQAHITLCRLLNIKLGHNKETPFTRVDLKTLETKHYAVKKDTSCPHCNNASYGSNPLENNGK